MALYRIENEIQKYAWGSTTAIPELLGAANPKNEPMAELWMGAHPKSPSNLIKADGSRISLDNYIAGDSQNILGDRTNSLFAGRLPFLFKVLAAGSPLSIQAHPNLEQARAGFARENAEGIALDAYHRNYKDDNHKPEIIYAITDYTAMRGFKSPAEIGKNFWKLKIDELSSVTKTLTECSDEDSPAALKDFFTALMTLGKDVKEELLDAAVTEAFGRWSERGYGMETEAYWIGRFATLYPGDIGIISPLYLNIINLRPGQAMYLPAGELHAYLEGLGIELMANSDNVLRGGLTPKHIDVPELLSTLGFTSGKPEVLEEEKLNENESFFSTPVPEFCLSRIELGGDEYIPPEIAGGPAFPSILICVSGTAVFTDEDGHELSVDRGGSVFAEYGTRMKISGKAVLFRASVPGR